MPKLPSEHADISPEKARKILHDGHVRGHPLTEQQRKFFGAIASKLKKKKMMEAVHYARSLSSRIRTK